MCAQTLLGMGLGCMTDTDCIVPRRSGMLQTSISISGLKLIDWIVTASSKLLYSYYPSYTSLGIIG